MKKIILASVMMAITNVSYAQLKVNSSGDVAIKGTYDSEFGCTINSSKKPLRCYHSNGSGTWATGVSAHAVPKSTGQMAVGVSACAYNQSSGSSSKTFGVIGVAGFGSTGWNFGILGLLHNDNRYGAAVYGGLGSSDYGQYMDKRYAGFFNGPVKVNGDLTVTGNISGVVLGNGTTTGSMTESTLIIPQKAAYSNSATSMLHGLEATSYYFARSDRQQGSMNAQVSDTVVVETPLTAMQEQVLTKQHHALNADQLEEVFPDLVYENEDGSKSINYVEMVPILVQAINELSAKIETLEGSETKPKTRAANSGKSVSEMGENVTLLSLGENKPNPFSNTTTIPVSIPEDVQKAFIYVYDLTGKKLQQVDITTRGMQNITLDATALTDGMYLYSLIADGKVVQTRRMIVEK